MNWELGHFISFAILLITISSVSQWISLPSGNTFFWWAIYISTLIAFVKARKVYFDPFDKLNIKVLLLYLTWNIICILRGVGIAENYWEWKNLVGTTIVLLLPISIYISTNSSLMQYITSTWIKYALPAFFFFLPFFNQGDAIGNYLVPISFLLLFFPLLPKRWKMITLILSILVVFGAPSARSNVIKFSISLLFSMLLYFKEIISRRLFEFGRWLLLTIPVILFILAVSGRFNIFKMDEYLQGDYTTTVVENGKAQEEDLTADTRTLIYEEVLSSAVKYDYVWFGRTPARGNESQLFGLVLADELHTGKMERFANEVSILNIFTWTGITGVILYFLIFYQASYLAINKSNSKSMQIVGLYVAFRWLYAWVEDFSEFNLSYFFLWAMIGMCFSKSFRVMNDLEVKSWIRGIFDKRYRKINLPQQFSDKHYLNELVIKD